MIQKWLDKYRQLGRQTFQYKAHQQRKRYTGKADACYIDWIFYAPEAYRKRAESLTDSMQRGQAFGL